MRGSWRGVEAARTRYFDLRHRKTNDFERVEWALVNYKQLAMKGLYTFVRAVVLVVSMAVPDLAVAPRRGGNGAVRAGILGIRVIVIEREWEIKRDLPSPMFALLPSSRAGCLFTNGADSPAMGSRVTPTRSQTLGPLHPAPTAYFNRAICWFC